MLIGVAPRREPSAVWAPGAPGWPRRFADRGKTKVPQTYDWRDEPGSAGNTRGVEPVIGVHELTKALEAQYETDCYAVSYVIYDPFGDVLDVQPRLSKTQLPGIGSGADWVRAQGYSIRAQVLFADADNEGHAPWTDESWEAAKIKIASAPALRTCGVYRSSRGMRLVQPMVTACASMAMFERLLWAWLATLERDGIRPDRACRDWTRFQRLPYVTRADGVAQLSTGSVHLDLSRMTPIRIELPVVADEPSAPASRPARAKPVKVETAARVKAPVVIGEVPAVWMATVRGLAAAVKTVDSEWHTLFMAISGALLRQGADGEWLPELIRAVSIEAGDTRVEDRVEGARSTVERMATESAATGMRLLRQEYPAVAEAVEVAVRAAVEAPVLPTPQEAGVAIRTLLWTAPPGTTLVGVECGLGKTAAAIDVAVARAEKTKADGTESERALPQSKTGISVPTNELARQVADDLRMRGARVLRVFGPLSVIGPDGQPVCRYYESAAALQAGGQSVPWEMCSGRGKNPCDRLQTCPASAGMDGPADARVIVGTHSMVAEIAGGIGVTGLMVIDEPPALLENYVLELADLDEALAGCELFEKRFSYAVAPAIAALKLWAATVAIALPYDLGEIVRMGAEQVSSLLVTRAREIVGVDESLGNGDALFECVRSAREADARGSSAPLKWREVDRARRTVAWARKVGRISKVYSAVYESVENESPTVFRVDETANGKRIVVTRARKEYSKVLRRDGATVLMDASIEIHSKIVSKVVGYDPPLHRFTAEEGAPVSRMVIHAPKANRKGWWKNEVPQAAPIARALAQALRLVGPVGSLAIITWKAVRFAIESARDPENASAPAGWRDMDLKLEDLRAAQEILAPVLAVHKGTLHVGHYGAVRGLNSMAECDALITLGDPWPHYISARNDSFYCELPDWQQRYQDLVAAELEQAHGRLRTFHRVKPATAVHVGIVRPGGGRWTDNVVRVVDLAVGRVKTTSTLSSEGVRACVEKLGGVMATVGTLGLTRSALHLYLNGERAVPHDVAETLRKAAGLPDVA